MIEKFTKRGCGYCLRERCSDYGKGVFILDNIGLQRSAFDSFVCTECTYGLKYCTHPPGHKYYREDFKQRVRREVLRYERDELVFNEVAINYNYDVIQDRYTDFLLLYWPNDAPRNRLEFSSPLIRTEKRAALIAQHLFSNALLRPEIIFKGEKPNTLYYLSDSLPGGADYFNLPGETILNFDKDYNEFNRACQNLQHVLDRADYRLSREGY